MKMTQGHKLDMVISAARLNRSTWRVSTNYFIAWVEVVNLVLEVKGNSYDLDLIVADLIKSIYTSSSYFFK